MSDPVPEGWETRRLADLSTPITKGSTPTTYGFGWETSGIRFLRSECVKASKFSLDGAMYISQEAHDALKRSKIKGGDILITITGYIGQACVFPEEVGEANINQHIARIRVDDKDDAKYITFFLNSEQQQREYQLIQTGQAYPQLSLKQIQDTLVPFPPAAELKKITAILTSVDSVIESTQAQINKLQDLKTGMMQELLTRGIGHSEFKDSPVGRIPVGWDVGELKEFLSFMSYGFTNPMPESDAGPYMVTARDINNLSIEYDTSRKTSQEAFDELLTAKSRPVINDLLLTKDGTLGRVALVDRNEVCINQSVAVLRTNEKVIPKFLLYLLAAPQYQREMLDKAGGSTIKHIYITVVDKMKVAIPYMMEQRKIVDILDGLNTKLSLAKEKLAQNQNIKKALMQDLLTGKVRVKTD